MKKWLIIVLALSAMTWLLVLPGVVGLVLSDRVPAWLAESAASAESRFESGWFSSRLALTDTHLAAELEARHVPPTRPGWLQVSGTVDLPPLVDGSRIDGFVRFDGRTRVALDAPELRLPGPPHTTIQALALELEQAPAGATRLELSAAGLGLANGHGLKVDYASPAGDLLRERVDETTSRLALALRLGEPADPQSLSLALSAAPINDAAFEELLDGLGQWQSARPDTYDEQLALLTLAGAWQGLASAGLVVELDHLTLGASTRMQGRWEAASGQPRISGDGQVEALLEGLTRIVALSRDQPDAVAEREARAWLRVLVERAWLIIEDERFRFAYPSDSADSDDAAASPAPR